MRVKGKSSNTPHPIWVQGEYTTTPPRRPNGEERPEGHYIDKGGYPGANVYAVSADTVCRQTAALDRLKREIYERDILLYETEEEIGYFIVEDTEIAVDIINGEILELGELQTEDIKIIGNLVDFPDFIEGMRYHTENGLEIPYMPALNVQVTALPYLKMNCLKCGHTMLSCSYMAKHKDCGGYLTAEFTTKVYRERQKEKAFA